MRPMNSADSAAIAPEPLLWTLGRGRSGLASVIVTAFNQDWVLKETLSSVAKQRYRPIECVIVDDGSTDRTAELITTLLALTPASRAACAP